MEDVNFNLEESTLEKRNLDYLDLPSFLETKSYEFSLHNSNYKVK